MISEYPYSKQNFLFGDLATFFFPFPPELAPCFSGLINPDVFACACANKLLLFAGNCADDLHHWYLEAQLRIIFKLGPHFILPSDKTKNHCNFICFKGSINIQTTGFGSSKLHFNNVLWKQEYIAYIFAKKDGFWLLRVIISYSEECASGSHIPENHHSLKHHSSIMYLQCIFKPSEVN